MFSLRALRSRARYEILTPAALLGVGLALAATAPALATMPPAFIIPAGGSYTNSILVQILDGSVAVGSEGNVTTFTNTSTGQITTSSNTVVDISANVDTFSNAGLISSAGDDGVHIRGNVTTSFTNSGEIYGGDGVAIDFGGTVASFANTTTGRIGSDGNDAVYFDDAVGSFTNAGQIKSDSYAGVYFNQSVTSFSNSATGLIESVGGAGDAIGVYIEGDEDAADGTPAVTTFTNAGTILSGQSTGVYIGKGSSSNPAAGSILNSGNVFGAYGGFDIYGDVGNFTNTASGKIAANMSFDSESAGVAIFGNVTGTFTNAGSITANSSYSGKGLSAGVLIFGDVANFENSGSIVGTGAFDGESASLSGIGVLVSGNTGSFTNSGKIEGSIAGVAFGFDGEAPVPVTSFTNTASGTITGLGEMGVGFSSGVDAFDNAGTIAGPLTGVPAFGGGGFGNEFVGVGIANGVTSFTNSGTISGYGGGVEIYGRFGTFANSGTITGTAGPGLYASAYNFDGESSVAAFGSLTNSGTIEGRYYGALIDNDGPIAIINSGTIRANDVTPFDNSFGLVFNTGDEGTLSTLVNSGTIEGGIGLDVDLHGGDVSITNSGSIIGTNGPGITFNDGPDPTIVNSGLISGSAGIAVDFGATSPDTLILQTGGKFIGAVKFGTGTNTFDFSGYHGNMLFDYTGSDPTLVAGDHLHAQSGKTIALVDDTFIRNAAQPLEDIVGAVNGGVSDALSGAAGGSAGLDSFVANYAPSAPTPAAGAAMNMGHAPAPTGVSVWGNVFGGGGSNSSGAGATDQFGGLAIGAQTEVSPGLTMGLVGSYGRTSFTVNSGPQTVTSNVGVVGAYGRTTLDTVTLDFSLLGGLGSNDSSRTISTSTGTEIGSATYSSWFIAPTVGISVPVLKLDKGEFAVAGSLGYIGGTNSAYSETGSTAAITVGSQTIGIFTASAELDGKTVVGSVGDGDLTLTGKLGVFTQNNAGGSSVDITALGLPAGTSVASGATGAGVFAGAGLEVPVSDRLSVGGTLTASARSDGEYAGVGRLKIGGSF